MFDGGSVTSAESTTLTCFNTCWVRVVNSCWLEGLPAPPTSASSVSYPLSDLFLDDPGLLLTMTVLFSFSNVLCTLWKRTFAGMRQ